LFDDKLALAVGGLVAAAIVIAILTAVYFVKTRPTEAWDEQEEDAFEGGPPGVALPVGAAVGAGVGAGVLAGADAPTALVPIPTTDAPEGAGSPPADAKPDIGPPAAGATTADVSGKPEAEPKPVDDAKPAAEDAKPASEDAKPAAAPSNADPKPPADGPAPADAKPAGVPPDESEEGGKAALQRLLAEPDEPTPPPPEPPPGGAG
jgi:hypothetical protein